MKKIIRSSLWIVIAVTVLSISACGGNASSTVVGNPTVPTVTKALGTYSAETEFNQDQLDAFDVTFGYMDNDCEDDDNVAHTITAGSSSDILILSNFFDYSDDTAQIAANYNTSDGSLSFTIDDDINQITCSGQLVEYSNEILLGLDCEVAGPQAELCGVSASKTST